MTLPPIIPHGKLLSRVTSDDARILLVESSNLDMFGRTRVSDPTTVADCSVEYDKQPLKMEEDLTGGGAAVHSPDDASVILSVGTASWDKVLRQSRQYCTYQKGKGHLVETTGSLSAAVANRISGMGYGDDEDGVFLVMRSTGPAILFRSSVTGSVVDTYVDKSDWNGEAVPDLDLTTSQILLVEFGWLGVAPVRVSLKRGRSNVLLHQFKNDNINPSAYWRTGTLPVRYWIENTGTTAAGGSMRQICWSVQSEGAFEIDRGYAWSAARYTAKSVSATAPGDPVFSIRPLASFQGKTNRVGVIPRAFEISADSNGVLVEVVHNPVLTGASWSPVDATHSAVEVDESTTSMTGGTVVWCGIVGSSGPKSAVISEGGPPVLIWLTNSIDGTTTTPLTIRARALATPASVRCVVRWTEIR